MNNTAIANSHFPCHSGKFQYFVLLIFSQIPMTTSLHDPLATSNTGSSKSMNLYFSMSNGKSFSVCFSPLKIIGVKPQTSLSPCGYTLGCLDVGAKRTTLSRRAYCRKQHYRWCAHIIAKSNAQHHLCHVIPPIFAMRTNLY